MEPMEYAVIALALIELALKVSPGIFETIKEIQQENRSITLADIELLRLRIKPPEAYFPARED